MECEVSEVAWFSKRMQFKKQGELSPYTSNINNSKLNAEDMNTHTTLDAKSSE